MRKEKTGKSQIDWIVTLIPFGIILALAGFLFIYPRESNEVIAKIRFFFGDTIGSLYLMIGLGVFALSIYLAFSRYGKIVLGGKNEKPKYSFFMWGSMMFTCGLAADILFYSFSEWLMYASNPYVSELGSVEEWVNTFSLFHWSFIPWAFYLVLAVAFGFMYHVRRKNRQRYSEACRPVLKNKADGFWGRLIDLFALFALLAGTATTFSVATPLMATIIQQLFHIPVSRTAVTILILIITCIIYTYAAIHGFKGIGILSKLCMFLFFGLLLYVLLAGGQLRFIVENGIQSFGKMNQNFIGLSTYTDPLRKNSFPQDWTIYYWAYWMVWCIAAPFFIGNISQGRTIKQTIFGGYVFGVGSTILSFIILENYGLGLRVANTADFLATYAQSQDLYQVIMDIISTLPFSSLVLILVLLCMIAFYATSFDSIAYTAACYSYKNLEPGKKPKKSIVLLWCILLIVLPIALVFSDSNMSNIQSISIISAFPIGIIIALMIYSFLKDANGYLDEQQKVKTIDQKKTD